MAAFYLANVTLPYNPVRAIIALLAMPCEKAVFRFDWTERVIAAWGHCGESNTKSKDDALSTFAGHGQSLWGAC